MKYSIYLLTLVFALSACNNKKKAMKKDDAVTSEKKEMSDDERRAAIAEEMKNEKIPNVTEDYYKYAEKEMPSNAVARIQRTNCFGKCPVYTLTVFKDGRLEYFGKKFTPREGKFEAQVDQKKIEDLMNEANELGYNNFKNIYDNEAITDLPSTITSLRNNGQLKTVVNRFDAPDALRQFEKFFDELFGNADWKPVGNE